jgi:hypothetical protein
VKNRHILTTEDTKNTEAFKGTSQLRTRRGSALLTYTFASLYSIKKQNLNHKPPQHRRISCSKLLRSHRVLRVKTTQNQMN